MQLLRSLKGRAGALLRGAKQRAKFAIVETGRKVAPRYPLTIVDGARGFAVAIDHADTAVALKDRIGSTWPSGVHLLDWAAACLKMDFHAAAKAARRWIEEDGGGARIEASTTQGRGHLQVTIDPGVRLSLEDKLEVARATAEAALKGRHETISGETLAGGAVQYFCLRGDYARAAEFLSKLKPFGETSYLAMLGTAIELRSHGSVPEFINQLLGAEGNYFEGKFCDKPFVDFEVTPTGAAYICCPTYLPFQIGNIKHGNTGDLINSERAKLIRQSIINGKFTYCDWTKCKAIKTGNLVTLEAARKDERLNRFIEKNDGNIGGPQEVRLSYDSTCNLSCPSCRTGMIVAKGQEFDEIMRVTDTVVRPLLGTAQSVMMNGYGDIFASRSCRRLLETVSPETHPQLKFKFITNGVLLTEQEWEKFPNVHGMVDSIRVSVDAVKKETYDIVRRGGDFDKLQRNLEFMARLRREGVIREFMLSFVVQRQNFREMADFCRLGTSLGCDYIIFEVVQNWNTFPDYAAEAVHMPSHPLHQEYLKEVAKVVEINDNKTPDVSWMLSADFGYTNH